MNVFGGFFLTSISEFEMTVKMTETAPSAFLSKIFLSCNLPK